MESPSLQTESNSINEPESARDKLLAILATARRTLVGQLRAAGFWTAIALPFLYVPMLINGFESDRSVQAFLALLVVNLVALYVGRGHTPN